MLTLSLVTQAVHVLASLIVCARLTVRTASIVRGGLWLYGLFILGAVLFCVVLPVSLVAFNVDKDAIVHAFPEATGVVAVAFLGWVPAFAFAGLVRRAVAYSA
ncbi:MAG: hypothetical protein ABFE13_09920 [Phycisphaerales bacterium]